MFAEENKINLHFVNKNMLGLKVKISTYFDPPTSKGLTMVVYWNLKRHLR